MYGLLIRLGVRAVRLAVDAEYRAKMFPPEPKRHPAPERAKTGPTNTVTHTKRDVWFAALFAISIVFLLLVICARSGGLG